MKNKLHIYVSILFVFLMAGLMGCASMRVISSAPPVKTIVLDSSVEFKFGWGTKLSMPAGEYKPVLEDKDGYYYQAPSKIAARDIFSYIADGGLFIKRGEKTPSKWYASDDLGGDRNHVKTGNLPKNFSSANYRKLIFPTLNQQPSTKNNYERSNRND